MDAPLDNSKHRRLRQYSIASKVYELLRIHSPIKVSFSSLFFLLAKCDVMERERWPIPCSTLLPIGAIISHFERTTARTRPNLTRWKNCERTRSYQPVQGKPAGGTANVLSQCKASHPATSKDEHVGSGSYAPSAGRELLVLHRKGVGGPFRVPSHVIVYLRPAWKLYTRGALFA